MLKPYSKRQLRVYRNRIAPFKKDQLSSNTKRMIFDWVYHPRFDILIFILVFISIIMLVIELTHPDNHHAAGWMGKIAGKDTNPLLLKIDIVITMLFACEYLIKFWISPNKWKYFKQNFIELLALLPVLRIFRMIRILRIARLYRLIRMNTILDQNLNFNEDDTTDMVTVVMYLFFSIIFGTVGIMIFERGENEGFQHLSDGLWWCIVTITTVGYGDISPVTIPGKIVAVCIMFIGLAFYASLTGVISQTLIVRSRREKRIKMEESMFTQHIIVCGWNHHAQAICKQIIKDEEQFVLVLSTQKIEVNASAQIFFKLLDPTQKQYLEEAKLDQAQAVVLLSDEQLHNPTDRDARNILIAMNILSIRNNIPIIFQLQDENNREHVQQLGIQNILQISKIAGAEVQKMLPEHSGFDLEDVKK
ncbi:MAG: hypothetical protein CL916_07550 [Deltaproteobacteria bacterium]|nr:hypothetical protein [Deltaproteobacteria bacterium]